MSSAVMTVVIQKWTPNHLQSVESLLLIQTSILSNQVTQLHMYMYNVMYHTVGNFEVLIFAPSTHGNHTHVDRLIAQYIVQLHV